MANLQVSVKHLQIDKANSIMVASIAISTFLAIFTLVSVRALISQRNYQARVIKKKEEAKSQLEKNISSADSLIVSYKAFVGSSQNVIGGNPSGSGEKDGDNAKIVLDALPSKYDYPALTTSIEKLINKNGLKIDSITGSDDQVNQEKNSEKADPKPIDMPFEIVVVGDYKKISDIVGVFNRSIRPFSATKMILSAEQNNIKLDFSAKSYFQPAKTLELGKEVVK